MKRFLNRAKNIGGYKALIILSYIVNIIMLITFEYCDVDSLAAWSLNFWDLVFGEGNLGDFYEYTQLNIHGAAHANCAGNYLWLLPICIWNLPMWLVHKLTGTVLVTNFYSICWMKLFLVMALVVCSVGVGKICFYFTKSEEKTTIAYILMMSSPEIIMSTGYAGQDEIVYICVFVWALYFYLTKNWRKCYILMILATTLCPIMVIPSLIMVLNKQKSLICIGRDTLGLLLPSVIFDFIYRNDEIYQVVKGKHGLTNYAMGMINDITISLSYGEISIAMGVVICLFFWIYMLKRKEDTGVLFGITLSMVVISFLMKNTFYRLFLYLPFLIILVVIPTNQLNINMFLLTIVSYCRTFLSLKINYPQNMNMYYIMKNSWLTDLHGKYGLYDYLNHERGSLGKYVLEGEYSPLLDYVCVTCVYVAIGLLLFINYSYKNEKQTYDLKLSHKVSMGAYCACMPLLLAVFFKMLF